MVSHRNLVTSSIFAVVALSILTGCGTARDAGVVPARAVQLKPPAPQVVPLRRGEMPFGWKYNGLVGTVIQFVREDSDAAVNFHVFSSESWTAESVIRRLADEGASKPGVTVSGIFVMKGGHESGLKIRDSRIGLKRGRAVARTFPGRSSLGVLVIGLWPADRHSEMTRDFDKFLDWVRLD